MVRRAPALESSVWSGGVGLWLFKRRVMVLAPVFVAALFTARPVPALDVGPLQLPGIVLAGLGVLVGCCGWGLRIYARSRRRSPEQPERHLLVTWGPYARVRHPLYVANFAIGLGYLVFAGSMILALAYIPLFWVTHLSIVLQEEKRLAERYGDGYPEYARLVPRFLPFRRPFPSRDPGPCWDLVRESAEFLKVLAYLAGLAVLGLLRETGILPVIDLGV